MRSDRATPARRLAVEGRHRPVRSDPAYAVVPDFGDEDVALGVNRDVIWLVELCLVSRPIEMAVPVATGERADGPVGRDAANGMVPDLRDEEVPLLIHRNPAYAPEGDPLRWDAVTHRPGQDAVTSRERRDLHPFDTRDEVDMHQRHACAE